MADAIQALPVALASEGKSAPEWIELIPAGPEILARDGRRFRLSDPQAVVRAFTENGAPLPIDVEHATQQRADKGLDAPSYGWITAVEERAGAIWGRVEWTDQGRQWVEAGQYKFISPAINFLKDGGEIIRLVSAALTNKPALRMTALAREDEAPAADPVPAQHAYGEIAGALGLAQDAALPEILSAIAAREAASPALAAAEAVTELLADRNAKAAQLRQIEAERIVDQAICGAYFPPALRRFALTLCAADPELFQEVLRSEEPAYAYLFETPAIFRDQRPRRSVESYDDDAAASIARQLGLDPETLR